MFEIIDYSRKIRNFNELLYIFHYEGEIRNIILNYKFNNKPYIYKTISKFLENDEKMCVQIRNYDIIIPVPISKKRMKTRGYNQSAILAQDIAKKMNIDYEDKLLIKIKDNLAQSMLEEKDREENVRNVYKITKFNKIINKKILLVDDIFTTGSTVNECSRILKLAGAKNIGVFTIAKD